jgi:predicted outer membrane repeat protein
MKTRHLWLNLILVLGLVIGSTLFFPSISPHVVIADDATPPGNTPTGLDVLEAARQQGPEAVAALMDTLRGKDLDLAMGEILEAQQQLARSAAPRPASKPVSPAEEEAVLQANLAREAASRARAFELRSNPADDETQQLKIQSPTAPGSPAADRTVGSAPCTYATIAAAMTAANAGDRLLLEGGVTFNANLSMTKNLTLQGGYAGCGSHSATITTINGGGVDRVMYINGNLIITLDYLNITHGYTGGNGAGIFVGANAQVIGTNLNIYNNTSVGLGGGIRLLGGRASFSNTNIYNNTAVAGAGVHGEISGANTPVLNLTSYADIYDNQALTGSGYGGGIYMSQGTVSLADCSDINSNDAKEGGGAYLITSTLTIGGSCSEIQSNTATGNGGGIYAQDSTVNLDNLAELTNNRAGSGGGPGSGGGAYLDNSDLWSDMASITFNTASNFGGGVYAANTSLLDMDLGGYPCNGPRCSQLSHNTATLDYGGGVYGAGSSEIDLVQTFIESNSAVEGGGIYAQTLVYLNNSLLARNDSTSGNGDGIRLNTGASLSGQNNTLANNNAGGAATGEAISLNGATLSLSDSIVWGHTISIDLAGQTVTCSDIQGGYTGTDNLDVNPLFIDPASSNFHLQSQSPLIDRCAAGQTHDFDNEARPVSYIRPAKPYDMGADEASTRVGINGAACAYGRIQDAVDAAASGATIQAEADTFHETVDITGKNLTLVGGYDANCTTPITAGTTTINGDGGGSVFDIDGNLVTLRNLLIIGGNAIGGGVDVFGGSAQVTLDNTDISNNQATYGGGIYVAYGSVVTLTNDSDIHNNMAASDGGGARVWGKLIGNDLASTITNNIAPNGGGVSVAKGELDFKGSITSNQATDAAGKGGGIHVYSNGIVTISGSSNVVGNMAFDGAGIYADAASLILTAVIYSNVAANNGGGVYLANGSTLTANNTYIGYPNPSWGSNTAVNGAGLYIDASTLNFNGYIYNNIASTRGGGIYANAATLNLTDANVGGASANQANQLGINGHEGAGLYVTNATKVQLTNTTVSSNTFQTTGYTYGGGAYVTGGSVLTMVQSTIEHHLAPSATDGRGAGLYMSNSTATLNNASHIVSNTAGMTGGGIRLYGTSTLTVMNGSELRDNHATHGEGGAVTADIGSQIDISDSVIQNNSAGTNGGAIFNYGSTLNVTRTRLHHNNASVGGAIYQDGASAAAEVSNCLVHHNTVAAVSGAGIHRANGAFTLRHATIVDNVGGPGFSGQASAVYNSIVWGNSAPGFSIVPLIASCNIDDGGLAGLNTNPVFVASGAGENYHLLVSSPAVDACATGLPLDLDNKARPSRTRYDMGAYEFIFKTVFLPLVKK